MKKKILCTIIFSLLVLTACSSGEKSIATPDKITPTQIVETQRQETIFLPVIETEKPTEPTEVETVGFISKPEENYVPEEVAEPINRVGNKTPTPTTKPTQKPTEKVKSETVVKEEPKAPDKGQDIQNMVSYIISHNQSKGMMYDSSLNTGNSGWLFAYQGCLNSTTNRTYEEQLSRTVSGLDADIDSILALDNYATSYSQMRFNCYAEKQSDGEYNIYFCYG